MAETLYNYPIVVNGSMAGNITSPIVDLSKTDGYGIYAVWTGSPSGTIELQGSLTGLPQDFVTIPNSATPVSGPGNALWEVTTAFYAYVQVVYVASSGSGSLNARVLGKGDLLA
jgi:hypothetical protein